MLGERGGVGLPRYPFFSFASSFGTGVYFPFFFFFLPSTSLREIRIPAPAVLFSLSRARQQTRRTVILVDHTWRAKLSFNARLRH